MGHGKHQSAVDAAREADERVGELPQVETERVEFGWHVPTLSRGGEDRGYDRNGPEVDKLLFRRPVSDTMFSMSRSQTRAMR